MVHFIRRVGSLVVGIHWCEKKGSRHETSCVMTVAIEKDLGVELRTCWNELRHRRGMLHIGRSQRSKKHHHSLPVPADPQKLGDQSHHLSACNADGRSDQTMKTKAYVQTPFAMSNDQV